MRIALGAAAALGAGLGCTSVSFGQVIEANWPTSELSVDLGPSSQVWAGWTLFGAGYGGGNNASGGSGYISHAYDFANNLTDIAVRLDELRNSAQPFTNTPYIRNHGQVVFTPTVNTPYALSGAIPITLTGGTGSTTAASGSLILEVLSGPTVATYGNAFSRVFPGTVTGNLFDSSTPLTGLPTGTLNGGTTYKLSWDFLLTSVMNGDSFLSADVSAGPSPYFAISFVPSPGPAALGVLLGLYSGRRRRV